MNEDIILYIAMIGFLLAAAYIVGLGLDWKNDHNVCEIQIKEFLRETDHHINCYANEDSSHYNFGKDILCSCFWSDENLRRQYKDFLSGTLKWNYSILCL